MYYYLATPNKFEIGNYSNVYNIAKNDWVMSFDKQAEQNYRIGQGYRIMVIQILPFDGAHIKL